MKTLAIQFDNTHNSVEDLERVYDFVRQVFRSLPPRELLTTSLSDLASYHWWYDANFTDSSDGWHSGPSLMVGEDYFLAQAEGTTFRFTTPTSRRVITIRLRKGGAYILDLKLEFPGGSIHAARQIWDDLLFEQIIPSIFTVEVEGKIQTYYGDVVRSLKPFQLVPRDENYRGEGFDVEYCLSSEAILASGLSPMQYPDEYERRVLAQASTHVEGRSPLRERPPRR